MTRIFLLLALHFAFVCSASAAWVQRELDDLEQESRKDAAKQAQYTDTERDLRSRLAQVPADSPEAIQTGKELAETRQVIDTLIERQREEDAKKRSLLASPEYQIGQSIAHDKRRPTRRDLSGIWWSPPNLVGYTLQLNQRGKVLTGRGYYHGCGGVYETFKVTGIYTSKALSITLLTSVGKTEKHVFHYRPWRNHLAFQGPGKRPYNTLIPAFVFHYGS